MSGEGRRVCDFSTQGGVWQNGAIDQVLNGRWNKARDDATQFFILTTVSPRSCAIAAPWRPAGFWEESFPGRGLDSDTGSFVNGLREGMVRMVLWLHPIGAVCAYA